MLHVPKPSNGQLIGFSLRAALEDFFRPLRTNDTRADFFAIYRRESEEFDRDYARKYDEDLNTSLIFVSCRNSLLALRTRLLILKSTGRALLSG